MAFQLEALPAQYGDSIILHWGDGKAALIDGGPSGVWNDSLKGALERLGAKQGGTPTLEFLAVSHIDADHITGILDLTEVLLNVGPNQKAPVKIRRAWHNSFDDIVDNTGLDLIDTAASVKPKKDKDARAVVASVNQGRQLRDALNGLKLDGNRPFKAPLILATGDSESIKTIAGLKITIICPNIDRVQALQKKWAKEVEKLKKKEAEKAQLAELLDRSVPNLSSIAFLAEAEGRRMLLTGDARGDDVIQGLGDAGLLDDDGRIELDVLKLPHHGSDRNVDENFFDKVRARHYIASGDGVHGNPEAKTFRYLSQARDDDEFTVHITYPSDGFAKPECAEKLIKFFAKDQKDGRIYGVAFRDSSEESIFV